MMKKFLLVTLSVTALSLTSACTSSPVSQQAATTLPQLTYEHLIDIPVKVSKITMVDEIQHRTKQWDIADHFPTPLDVAVKRYVQERYKAVGANGELNITLREADINFDDVPNSNKILSIIPLANEHQYTLRLIMDITSHYISGFPDRTVTIKFARPVRMAPHVTVAYREAYLQRAMEELVIELDKTMSASLVHELNIVDPEKLPLKAIDIKTDMPKMETIYSLDGAVAHHPVHGETQWRTDNKNMND